MLGNFSSIFIFVKRLLPFFVSSKQVWRPLLAAKTSTTEPVSLQAPTTQTTMTMTVIAVTLSGSIRPNPLPSSSTISFRNRMRIISPTEKDTPFIRIRVQHQRITRCWAVLWPPNLVYRAWTRSSVLSRIASGSTGTPIRRILREDLISHLAVVRKKHYFNLLITNRILVKFRTAK